MIRLNRYFYIIILLCFFLPFCEGCNFLSIPAEEKAAMEKSQKDCLEALSNITVDSLMHIESSNSKSDSASIIPVTKESGFLQNVISYLMLPNGDYSGIYLVVIGFFSLKGWLSVVPGFIVLIILIYLTNKTVVNYKRVFIYSLAFLLLMLVFLAFNFNDLMYGFWICLMLGFINTTIAGFMRSKSKYAVRNN
jgi:membrane-bound ClpP family serine protease